MKPIYEQEGIALYNADAREVLPHIGRFDLLHTDPPYGIGADNQKRTLSRANKAKATDYGQTDWDSKPPASWLFGMLQEISTHQIIWGGNYFTLPPSSCWLVWDKQSTGDFADCELAWTNLEKAVRRITHLWNGMLRAGNEARFHPTQKPLAVTLWAIQQAPAECETILDPFAGSGTTGVAAKQLGRKCILIEREPKYCQIIIDRLAQNYLPLNATQQKQPEQSNLITL